MGAVENIQDHVREIERCNQRGGRMLSIADLIMAGTLGIDTAAYLLATISRQHSFLVGAQPGGAGKTTVMGALLNFVPPAIKLAPADDAEMPPPDTSSKAPRRCYICHEIGPGTYYGYLWGASLRRFFSLTACGHMLATNLHADNPAQAQNQICIQNGVPENLFRQIQVLVFLHISQGWPNQREIAQIWESDGHQAHQLVYDRKRQLETSSQLADPASHDRARGVIRDLVDSKRFTISEVRSFLVARWSML